MDRQLSKVIRIKLIENDWTLKDLANNLNLSTAYVSDILNQKKDGPKAMEHVDRMMDLLKIDKELSKN